MTEQEAFDWLCRLRWPRGPRCPRCGQEEPYHLVSYHLFRCAACPYQFSVTADTHLSSHKMSLAQLVRVIDVLVNRPTSVREASKLCGITGKTGHIFCKKVRGALAGQEHGAWRGYYQGKHRLRQQSISS